MSTFYFVEKLGNTYQIGCGERNLGKLWFRADGESASPLSQEDAERICLKIVDYLNKNHPISDEMAEEYGDSNDSVRRIREINEFAESDDSDDDCDCGSSADTFLKLMMLKAMMGD